MKKSVLYGCLVPSIVVVVLGVLSVVLICFVFSGMKQESISIEQAEYPGTESLRQLSGLSIIPNVTYVKGTIYHGSFCNSGWKDYIYHYADSVITPKDEQAILRRAKAGNDYFWLYGEKNYSNACAIYKGYNISTDEVYEIYFFDSIIHLSLHSAVGFIEDEGEMAKQLGVPAFPKFKVLNFYSEFNLPLNEGEKLFALQLQESPEQLKSALLGAGYVLSNRDDKGEGYLLEKKSNNDYIQSYIFVSFPSSNHVTISFEYL